MVGALEKLNSTPPFVLKMLCGSGVFGGRGLRVFYDPSPSFRKTMFLVAEVFIPTWGPLRRQGLCRHLDVLPLLGPQEGRGNVPIMNLANSRTLASHGLCGYF